MNRSTPPRLAFTPRHDLMPHPRMALKSVLLPMLPADADVRVRTLTDTVVVVGATLCGHRVVTRSTCPSQIYPVSEWAAEVARRLLAFRPPVLPPPLPPAPEGSPAWELRQIQ